MPDGIGKGIRQFRTIWQPPYSHCLVTTLVIVCPVRHRGPVHGTGVRSPARTGDRSGQRSMTSVTGDRSGHWSSINIDWSGHGSIPLVTRDLSGHRSILPVTGQNHGSPGTGLVNGQYYRSPVNTTSQYHRFRLRYLFEYLLLRHPLIRTLYGFKIHMDNSFQSQTCLLLRIRRSNYGLFG
ncbi:hypothetical protein DPMN_161250 [Dreissena polymorpha]|uniref:Uncharacterized protein n=1 Tax=Dreissena polymorpha TaxID=45954 RepID=A0A9D4EPM9_DREPO|nr:hypothetical protein DPMN_161250 [Dreissena polymorpha]